MCVGVEVGGTFTDLVLIDDGKLRVAKVPRTPGSPDIGALNAIVSAQTSCGPTKNPFGSCVGLAL